MKKKATSEKKNSLFKNIGIVIHAWFKRYPIAWLLVPLYLIARLVSPFLNTLLSSESVAAITKGDVKTLLIRITLIIIVIGICSAITNIIGSFLQVQRSYTRLCHFADRLFRKAMTTDYQNVELHKNQKLLGKASNAIGSNWNGPEELMTQTLNITITFLGIFSYGTIIFTIDWKILLVILAMFVCNVSLQSAAIRYSDKHREESSEIWRKKNYVTIKSTNISAGKDVRIYQLQNWFFDIMDDVIKRRRDYQARTALHWYFPTMSDVTFNFLRDWLAYSILIKRVLDGQIDVATFTLYLGLIGTFSSWIYTFAGNFSALKRSSHEFNDYFDFMNLPERKVPASSSTEKLADTAPQIEFKNVEFKYDGSDKNTLENLNFTIHAGEKIALVGNNGAGKTTIVKLLTGLYRQTGGEILVNGKSIDDIGLENYQDIISVLFQDTNPMAFTLEENVSSQTSQNTDHAKVLEALDKAGLTEKVQSLKNKEKTYITQNLDDEGILLSGGETQKLLLAKAIYKGGHFLILDEPTSALDPLAESKIYEEYNKMADGKTALFISHRLASTKFCNKIMFLENGKIAEFGTHEELMKKGGKYKEMFEIQSQYYVEK